MGRYYIEVGRISDFRSIIKSPRHWQPCIAWRSNPQPTRQPAYAGDCFVPRNDEKIEKLLTK